MITSYWKKQEVALNEAEFMNKLEELLEIDANTLVMTTLLADVREWNSMAVLAFIAMADEDFGTSPSPKAIAACTTVADLMALALAK
jgi:acyl carrier protein